MEYQITNNSEQVGLVLALAFSDLALSKYFSYDESFENLVRYYTETSKFYINNGALVTESSNFKSISIWLPPSIKLPMCESNCERFDEYKKIVDSLLEKYMISENGFWYLQFLACNPSNLKSGYSSKLVKPILQESLSSNIPIALEASNLESKAIYEHWGFKTYAVINLGKGLVDNQGKLDQRGEGFELYFMIFNNGK